MKEDTNEGNVTQSVIYKKITIFNTTKKHAGYYVCLSSGTCENKESNKVFKEFVGKYIIIILRGVCDDSVRLDPKNYKRQVSQP